MDNADVAAVFTEMADLTQIVGGNPHRIRSFRRTARIIESLPDEVATMIKYGTLDRVPGIGPGSLRRVKDILRTGTTDDHRRLRQQLPPGLRELLDVKGIGAPTARRLWQQLKIGSIDQLEWAIRAGAVRNLPRMGQRTSEKLLKAIRDHRLRIGRVPWVESRRLGQRLVDGLLDRAPIVAATLAGSVRRGKATIRDIDVLVASERGAEVTATFATLPEVEEVLIRGEGRCSVRLFNRQQADLRVLPPDNWGAGMHYFTGSKLHNIAVRVRGLKVAGLKISDKGIFLRDTEIRVHSAPNEVDVFTAARLPFIEPAIRENTGEVEAAAAGRLPRLITGRDLAGDLHMHTLASDGRGTAQAMAEAAMRLGHRYIAITDHTQSLTLANGLDERRLLSQGRHLRDLEDRLGTLRIARGVEVDILADGSLDLDEGILRELDWVVASVHSHLDMDGDSMTDRLIAAIESGVVDCIGHPLGRRLGDRAAADLDLGRLLQAARRAGVALEINGNPYRMDLDDIGCRRAKEMGVALCLNTDAHAPDHLARQEFGVITAQRGWIEPTDVLNTRNWTIIADRRRDRFRTRGVAVGLGAASGVFDTQVHTGDPTLADHHWPEHTPVRSTPKDSGDGPPVDVDDAPIDEAVDDADEVSVRSLNARPLAAHLRLRIETWLRQGEDEPLEEALKRLGDNPMQTAFDLLFTNPAEE
ncbi:MAG: PHP domain-containing protein [Myxococcota bacterium]